ncbi:phosphotransferase [Microvirga aerophila]|uniref:Hydroxylysine kinase n=1 Tax=Microvirga aerophila TaxID=670291 RepID=A0A512BXY3_9HYPH|nr:phosphotransferase [Microvirga aerophila]GEO16717.1 homoserine kinase [Microvirga aerophila]
MTFRLDCDQALLVARKFFGKDGQAIELSGERTQNFHIISTTGEYLLKISSPAEDLALVDLETRVLQHVAQTDPALPVPRVLASLDGDLSVPIGGGPPRVARLLQYLPGIPLSESRVRSTQQRFCLGRTLAKLDLALSSFDDPLAHHRDLIWDIKRASQVRPFLTLIDPNRRGFLKELLDRFEQETLPRLEGLSQQIIHNDMNMQNVLVDTINNSRVAAILDFGDVIQGPRVIDLAVLAAAQTPELGAHPLSAASEIVAAYHAVAQLSGHEIDILFDLMIARYLVSVTVTEWLAQRDPSNRRYIMKNNKSSWHGLERLTPLPRAEAQELFRDICRGSATP